MKLFGGVLFKRWLDWQWRIVRFVGLVVSPLAIAFVTVVRLVRADPESGQTQGEMIGMGAIMIGIGFVIVAGTWWIKAVLELLIDKTERGK